MDRDLRQYLELRAKPPTPDQEIKEAELVGKWAAKRKVDAIIVASAVDYDALESELLKHEIDPESVVLGVIQDPSELFVD